jgi:hypothetical protein
LCCLVLLFDKLRLRERNAGGGVLAVSCGDMRGERDIDFVFAFWSSHHGWKRLWIVRTLSRRLRL